SVGTGIGMGLVLGGQLVRGAHGVAGEIAYMPMSGGEGTDPVDARRRGVLEASASAPAVVRAARRAGMRGQVSARRVFTAAARGDARAAAGRARHPGRRPWRRAMTGGLMAAEMADQPEVLARLVDRAPADAAAVRAVVPSPLAGIVFLARGSSDNAAVFGRYLAELCAGR